MKGYKPVITTKKEEVLNPFKNRIVVREDLGPKKNTVAQQYDSLKSKREPFLERARRYARLTLPALLPEDSTTGDKGDSHNQNGWQSLGSQCTNHLANKLVMIWFPPQRSFFRMTFTDEAKAALFEAGVSDTQLLQLMSRAEDKARMLHEQIQGRIAWTQAAKHLIVSGNAMLYLPEDSNLVCYPMDRYVIKRARSGVILQIIIEEDKIVSEFPPAVQAIIKSKQFNTKPTDSVKMYTNIRLHEEKYEITQEVVGILVNEPQLVAPDKLPFIPLVWERLYGEDYGRGHVENNAGDLFVYQFLSKAIAKGCALMSEVKFLVRRGSATSPQQHASADTGDYLWGEKDDINVVQLNKYADYNTVSSVLETYSKRLGQAFLLMSANRRDAERVTTYELRLDAQELETSLGGTYSQIAVSGQLPYANLLLRKSKFTLPATDAVPVIITGIEALGKAGEIDKLMQFSEIMAIPNGWSPAAQSRLKWSEYMLVAASNLNMETPWLMSEEEYAAMVAQQKEEAQNQQMMEMAGKAAPQLMKGQ